MERLGLARSGLDLYQVLVDLELGPVMIPLHLVHPALLAPIRLIRPAARRPLVQTFPTRLARRREQTMHLRVPMARPLMQAVPTRLALRVQIPARPSSAGTSAPSWPKLPA